MKTNVFPSFSHSLLVSCIIVSKIYAQGQQRSKQPNILIIVGDDVGTGDVPGHWNTGIVDMPNLEDLVSQGTTFKDAHGTPLCAPSRYVLLSGNYQHRGVAYPGLWNLNYESNQFKEHQMSIAEVLRDSGYDTGMFGKWHIGGKIPTKDGFNPNTAYAKKATILKSSNHNWTKPMEEGPWDIGFDTSYITVGGIQNPPYAFYRNNILEAELENIIYWPEGNYSMPKGISKLKSGGEGENDWDSSAYNMILVDETEDFLDDHIVNRGDDPFFAYVALGAAHIPHSPPDHYIDGTPVAGEYPNGHLDILNEMDKVVGSLVKALDDRQLLQDTIVVFTSDNGGLGAKHISSLEYGHKSNGPLRGSKGTIWEGGTRIPMTIRWDNGLIPKGESRSKLIGLNDLFATLCDLAGVDVPIYQAIDSVSFSNHIYDENEETRKYLGAWTYKPDLIWYESIRMNEMKLVRDYQYGGNSYVLYNLTADISETMDVSEGNENLVDEMVKTLETFGPCYDRKGRFLVATWGTKKIRKGCQWFSKKNTLSRCAKYPVAQTHCRRTCALKNKKYCQV